MFENQEKILDPLLIHLYTLDCIFSLQQEKKIGTTSEVQAYLLLLSGCYKNVLLPYQ